MLLICKSLVPWKGILEIQGSGIIINTLWLDGDLQFWKFSHHFFWFPQQSQQKIGWNKWWGVIIIPFWQVWKQGPQGGKGLAQGHQASERELSLRSHVPHSRRQHGNKSIPVLPPSSAWHWTSCLASLGLFPHLQSKWCLSQSWVSEIKWVNVCEVIILRPFFFFLITS